LPVTFRSRCCRQESHGCQIALWSLPRARLKLAGICSVGLFFPQPRSVASRSWCAAPSACRSAAPQSTTVEGRLCHAAGDGHHGRAPAEDRSPGDPGLGKLHHPAPRRHRHSRRIPGFVQSGPAIANWKCCGWWPRDWETKRSQARFSNRRRGCAAWLPGWDSADACADLAP